MNYRHIVIMMVLLPILSAFIGYNAGTISVISECSNKGKYERSGSIVICVVKDKSMLGTNLSWNKK